MKLFRIVFLLLGLVALAYAAKTQLDGTTRASPSEPTAPRRQLDNARDAARRIEDDAQKRLEEIERKAP